MKIKILITLIFISIFLLSACGAKPVEQQPPEVATPSEAAPTLTPDPCSDANLPDEVAKINDLMREFDDYSRLSSSTPQDQLVQVIPAMQEVRRRAESQEVPECLTDLKILQINHMNLVLEILMAFMGNAQAENVSGGINQARDLRMQYDVEAARLLGLTPPPTLAPPTPGANSTQPAGLSILNPGPNPVKLLATPDLSAGDVATLEPGSTTVAFGKTADGKWIQVEVPGQPGQKAWVEASLVQISGQLPVVTP